LGRRATAKKPLKRSVIKTTEHKQPIPTSYSIVTLKLEIFNCKNPLRERITTEGELNQINLPQRRITIIISKK